MTFDINKILILKTAKQTYSLVFYNPPYWKRRRRECKTDLFFRILQIFTIEIVSYFFTLIGGSSKTDGETSKLTPTEYFRDLLKFDEENTDNIEDIILPIMENKYLSVSDLIDAS